MQDKDSSPVWLDTAGSLPGIFLEDILKKVSSGGKACFHQKRIKTKQMKLFAFQPIEVITLMVS
ncbi:MAG: hypothetical protein GY868_10945 [Deltaproteobacteria bacterium]|nr:hypothetical protein [Deltaproteobacteria bacterium]